jgi:hypothetical protein
MFVHINHFLGAAGLRNPTLDILNQDGALYSTLLFQPGEGVAWGVDFVKVANRQRGIKKFRSFIELASERNVELAITPEYSCPWEVITELIDNQTLPEESKLWIIGCESIKANALHDLMANHNDITWITETQTIAANLGNNHFFNPVCYIFRTRSEANNQLRTVIIVQFKTQPLGGAALEWERDNFIRGTRIYIIQNIANSSRLVTLICSDILSPMVRIDQLPDFINIPYLVVHIQLNQAPNHLNFSGYRGDTYGMGRENKEFICLNWSRNISLGDINPWSHYGGSALYIKPENDGHLNTSDERINHNQSLGLYYTRWVDRYANIYFLNFDEYVFLLRTTKPSQLAVAPALRRRTGPEMTLAFHWQNDNWEAADSVNSDFGNSCSTLHAVGNYANLTEIYNESPVNAERLVCLSIGKALYDGWHEPRNNFFFKVKDDEINERLTFAQNPCADTQARRKQYLLNYGTLEYSIIINQAYIPDSISDLRGNCRIDYRQGDHTTNFNLNLYPQNDTGVPATGLFIGNSTREDALDILSKITALFKGDQFGKRVVVWYSDHNGHIQNEYCDTPPKITDDTTKSTRSIRRVTRKKIGQV